jgi:hypothetical protein
LQVEVVGLVQIMSQLIIRYWTTRYRYTEAKVRESGDVVVIKR